MHKQILSILLTLLTYTATSQAHKSIAIFNYPMIAQPSTIDPITKDTIIQVIVSQGFLDSLKAAYALALNAGTAASNAQTTANTATTKNTQQDGTIANQGLLLTAHTNQIANTQIDVATGAARTDSIVKNWPSGGTPTVPTPYNVIASQTIPLLPCGTDIWLNCGACTITFTPVTTPGWHYKIHNRSSFAVKFIFGSGLTKINSVANIASGSRPLDATYLTAGSLEVH